MRHYKTVKEEYFVTHWVKGEVGTAKIPVYCKTKDGDLIRERWVAKHEKRLRNRIVIDQPDL